MAATRRPNMPKKTVIHRVAQRTRNTQAYTAKVIDMFLTEVMRELAKGSRLEFRGLGTFEVVTRGSKLARNPKTGEEMIVPEHRTVRFRAGKLMQACLNGHDAHPATRTVT